MLERILLVMLAVVFLSVGAGCAEESLVLHYNFDEGTGSIADDRSGNGNDGKIRGAEYIKCGDGYALEFDGKNDRIYCGDNESLDITDTLTIEAWVKLANGVKSTIVGKGKGVIGVRVYGFGKTTGNQLRFYWTDDNNLPTSIVTTSTTFDDNWHHVAVTFNAGSVHLYIDGIDEKSGSGDTSIQSCASTYIGVSWSWAAAWANGAIDEVRIYNRALSANEIKSHYYDGAKIMDVKA